jgi:hypothetical protein
MADLPVYLLERVYLADRTLGSIFSPQGGIIAKTLELPWKENKRSISCIKEGIYTVTYSPPVLKDDPDTEADESGGRNPRPYGHYIVHNTPGRSGILIHRGSNPNHSQGCILVSGRFVNTETEEPKLDPGQSATKLQWMVDNLPKSFKLLIESKSGKPYLNK